MTGTLPSAPTSDSEVERPARRSLVAFACLAAGFLIARALPGAPTTPFFIVAQLCLIVALLAAGRACRAALCIGAVCFGAGWFALRIHESRADSLDRLLSPLVNPAATAPGPLITVHGVLSDNPEPNQPPGGSLGMFSQVEPGSRFHLRVESIISRSGPRPASGILMISLASRKPPPCGAGDRVSITGTWTPVPGPANPGEADRRMLAAQDGACGRLNVMDAVHIQTLQGAGTWISTARSVLASGLGALRSRAATTLDAALSAQSPDPEHRPSSRPSPGRALLAAMLLGEREPGLDGIETAFRRLGLVHLVAISGFNLAIVAGLVLFFLRLGPDRPVLEPLIVATLIILYMLVVPGEAPILRSGLTVLTFLAAETSGRRYDRLNLLGWIAVLLILFRPLDLFSLGFQLSFGIVAALLWLGRHAQERFFGVQIRGIVLPRPRTPFGHARRSFVDWAKAAISTSVLAWAVAIPTIAYHTGLVSPLAAITSILILPLVVVSLWIGYTVLRVYPSVGHGARRANRGLCEFCFGWPPNGACCRARSA